MIPKTIHYCWFGYGRKNKTILKCIESWKKYCPDYELIEWNEENVDTSNPFLNKALQDKKWAFAADVCRLDVLLKYGGVYLDTDMLLVKRIDKFLAHNCFFGVEEPKIISAGIIGSVKSHPFIKDIRGFYDEIEMQDTVNYDKVTIPLLITSCLNNIADHDIAVHKTKIISDIALYESQVFYPLPNSQRKDVANYLEYISKSSYAVHLWNASWVDHDEFDFIRNRKYLRALKKMVGTIVSCNFNLYYFKRIWNNFLASLKP